MFYDYADQAQGPKFHAPTRLLEQRRQRVAVNMENRRQRQNGWHRREDARRLRLSALTGMQHADGEIKASSGRLKSSVSFRP
jgi:hypothetical protein